MAQLRKEISIDASAEAVWAVLGDLAATSEWLPGTVAARMEGTVRICETADGGEIREEITDYSSEQRRYRYRHLQTPLPVESSIGTFSVEVEPGGATLVVLESEFAACDPAMEAELGQMFGAALDQALDSLRRRVERGLSWRVD